MFLIGDFSNALETNIYSGHLGVANGLSVPAGWSTPLVLDLTLSRRYFRPAHGTTRVVWDEPLHLTEPSGQANCRICGKSFCRACNKTACPKYSPSVIVS